MRLAELHLKAFGPFTNQVLRFGVNDQRLVLVHGLNEAGKSSALRAIAGLRFGINGKSKDRFLHDYKQMRVGGVFVDKQGKRYSLIRRKGTGLTLKFADFGQGGVELEESIPPNIHRLLTAGLSIDDYESMFGLDHETLRNGGRALVKGEGEIGAALFEASSGADDVSRILGALDTTAKAFYMPAAHAKNGRINRAMNEYKSQLEKYKNFQIRPTRWEAIAKVSRDASASLLTIQHERNQYATHQLLIRELIAVAPILTALQCANKVLAELNELPLLEESTAAERAAAEAGLSDVLADILTNNTTIRESRELIEHLQLDPLILSIASSVTRLNAATNTIVQLRAQAATAECDVISRTRALNALAAQIAPNMQANSMVQLAPVPTKKMQINGSINALEEAKRALGQHRLTAPKLNSRPGEASDAVPDTNLQAAVRIALAEVVKNNATLLRLSKLPGEIKTAERNVEAALAVVGLSHEQAAREVRPLLSAVVDEASQQLTELDSKQAEKSKRVEEMQAALVEQQDAIKDLLSSGLVPTRDDVQEARARREEGWTLVKATYIKGTKPDVKSFAQDQPLTEAYQKAVSEADALVDGLASDTGRATELDGARRQIGALERDLKIQQGEIQLIETQRESFETTWQRKLALARIPIMPPAAVRDWQDFVSAALTAIGERQGKLDELQHAEYIEKSLAVTLMDAVTKLGITKVDRNDRLETLVSVAEDNLKQVDARVAAQNKAVGQATELQKQAEHHRVIDAELVSNCESATSSFLEQLALLMLGTNATVSMAKARLTEFEELLSIDKSLVDAISMSATHVASLLVHQQTAQGISAFLLEEPCEDVVVAAEIWSTRLEKARAQQSKLDLAEQKLAASEKALANNEAKAARHRSTLIRLCNSAGVQTAAELPEVEERSNYKRQAMRDARGAAEQLAMASQLGIKELQDRLAGRGHDDLRAEELRIEQKLEHANARLEQARVAEETARRHLDSITSSDEAAMAAEAMDRAAATVRNTFPLQLRTRLAHALLQEAVRRFKERSQAPMLKSASRYFAQITGGEFEGLINDDSNETPVIAAKRPDGEILAIEAMSEGTRDQLYLALRLAALKLQRDNGVDLPVVLDDVLMASDDVRAGHIFKALADFSESGQVIVFTHHHHLCDVARQNVAPETIALVEIKRA
jgi:uncharacterized protein YhaN